MAKIINVIELSVNRVIAMTSFEVFDEQDSRSTLDEAEKCFSKKVVNNDPSFSEEELEGIVKGRYFSGKNGYACEIVYSYT